MNQPNYIHEIPKHKLTDEEIDELKPGDEIIWTDPDNDQCSKLMIIQTIERNGDIITIETTLGDTLECLSHELS